LRPGDPDAHGYLIRRPGCTWVFRYEGAPDEAGYHFQDQQFIEREYVSVREEGETCPFRVMRVEHL